MPGMLSNPHLQMLLAGQAVEWFEAQILAGRSVEDIAAGVAAAVAPFVGTRDRARFGAFLCALAGHFGVGRVVTSADG